MSKIIRIFLIFFFFIEEYDFRGTLFVIDKTSKENSNTASTTHSAGSCVCVKLRRENLEKKQYQEKQTATTKNSKQIKE